MLSYYFLDMLVEEFSCRTGTITEALEILKIGRSELPPPIFIRLAFTSYVLTLNIHILLPVTDLLESSRITSS